jgi:hypothetical protein
LVRMTIHQLETLLRSVSNWPEEDQDELVEAARDIAARRSGLYRASAEELDAIEEAEKSGIATPAEVEAIFDALRRA